VTMESVVETPVTTPYQDYDTGQQGRRQGWGWHSRVYEGEGDHTFIIQAQGSRGWKHNLCRGLGSGV
jgi:hypothetical protein